METIRSISCSIPENSGENHFIDKLAKLPCTSTQNVQNTNIAILLLNKCAKKPQSEVITILDASLRFKKIKIIQIKLAEDFTRNKTLICSEKIPIARENTLTKIFISSKYKSLLNSDTWGSNVLPVFNNSSQIVDNNIPNTDYQDIQNDNILEHSLIMKNGCNWFGPFGVCDQLKFYPNQIKFLSLPLKNKSEKLKILINTNFLWITTRQISYRF
jgi:hypothetical protein